MHSVLPWRHEPYLTADPAGYAGGWQEVVTIPNPAVASGFTYTVAGQYIERILAARWRLTADATVANRVNQIDYMGQDNVPISSTYISVVATAGQAWEAIFFMNLGAAVGNISNQGIGPMPDIYLESGYRLVIPASGFQAGDQISRIRLVVERHYSRGRHLRHEHGERPEPVSTDVLDEREDFAVETGTSREGYYR